MIIKERDKLAKWLDQNYWFEDGFISKIERIGQSNKGLKIYVGYQTEGSYVAGEPIKLKEFEIRPKNVSKWTYNPDFFKPGYDWCIEGIKLSSSEFGLIFETPNLFELECEELEISQVKEIETFTKPRPSDLEIFFEIEGVPLPKPIFWIEKLAEKGIDAGFRTYAGKLASIESVPYPDYSGYLIQEKPRIEGSNEGLFFFHTGTKSNHTSLSIQKKNDCSKELWNAFLDITTEWRNIRVSSGNVQFRQGEWKEYIKSGNLPQRIQV